MPGAVGVLGLSGLTFIAGTSPDWRANLGSNCQCGSLKPRRRLDTPMQRPLLIQALIITRRLGFLE